MFPKIWKLAYNVVTQKKKL